MGGLPAWEGGHPGRHAGWKPALLKEERDALHCSAGIDPCSDTSIRLVDLPKAPPIPFKEVPRLVGALLCHICIPMASGFDILKPCGYEPRQ